MVGLDRVFPLNGEPRRQYIRQEGLEFDSEYATSGVPTGHGGGNVQGAKEE